ncbi:hypothetical protein AA0228_1593 [Gluconobacter frateurii NRIC 0228]|uniref:Uncharacterized protein n=1 Tax=Gluconobacter frateurii NRIC 0228 TaxID=1307946 RepID=A0ABQ0QBN4_9PROT|nr:hypothetical protein AA0228_1593 [Gluconobacter frateurii NRIC 0228]
MLCGGEGYLFVFQQPKNWMLEAALAAFSGQNTLVLPEMEKLLAFSLKSRGQGLKRCGSGKVGCVGAEFCEQAS